MLRFAMLALFLGYGLKLGGQSPELAAPAIVHGATYEPGDIPFHWVTETGLAHVLGSNLAAGTASAEGTPLPRELLGTFVTFNGERAPLLSVSPERITLQVPRKPFLPINGSVEMTVTTPSGSVSTRVTIGPSKFGILTSDQGPCGRGMLFNLKNGSLERNTPANSAEPGGDLVVFGTGSGSFLLPPVPLGEAAPSDPPARLFSGGGPAWVTLGEPELEYMVGDVVWGGRAPGLVGVDQINLKLRDGRITEGCEMPLLLYDSRFAAQHVPINIRRGGGACPADLPPPTGMLRWEKTIATGSVVLAPEKDEFVLDFSRTPLPVRDLPPPFGFRSILIPIPGPRCPVADNYARRLELGGIQLRPPNGDFLTPELTPNGPTEYRAELPVGTIQPGTHRVSGGASVDIGPFATAIDIPPPIRITTDLHPGRRFIAPIFDPTRILYIPLKVTWEGGDPDSAVVVWILNRADDPSRPQNPYTMRAFSARASRGEVDIQIIPGHPEFQIEIWNYREGQIGTAFTVDGIPKPATHGWRYRYVFADLGARWR
ncbi:MAG: hypothetical protein JNL98_00695 [Bryobacterales bacterium]|nr:hypothetical protein [Bryobacterales bacterium]